MSASRNRNTRQADRKSDPNHLIHITGLAAGVIFGLGFLAALLGAVLTGDFTFGGLSVTVLALAGSGLGLVGWRRRQVAFSWGALALLLAAMALSRAVAG